MIKIISIITIVFLSVSMASDTNNTVSKMLLEKQVKEQMEKEKRYSIEQTFYQGSAYNLKGAEVNLESLKSLPEIEEDDFDMDSVYD